MAGTIIFVPPGSLRPGNAGNLATLDLDCQAIPANFRLQMSQRCKNFVEAGEPGYYVPLCALEGAPSKLCLGGRVPRWASLCRNRPAIGPFRGWDPWQVTCLD